MPTTNAGPHTGLAIGYLTQRVSLFVLKKSPNQLVFDQVSAPTLFPYIVEVHVQFPHDGIVLPAAIVSAAVGSLIPFDEQ